MILKRLCLLQILPYCRLSHDDSLDSSSAGNKRPYRASQIMQATYDVLAKFIN